MSKIERGLTVRVAEFKPHPMNYNAHPQKQIKALRESLRIFEQVRDVVVWREFIIAGHGVVEAAKAEGWTDISATRLPDDWDEERVLAYLAVDNETARLSESDDAQLAALLQGVSDEELRALAAGGEDRLRSLIEADAPIVDAGPQVDRAAELQEKWGVKRGQVWEVPSRTVAGRCHRVMCGDSMKEEKLRQLMSGEEAGAVITDPPYASGGLHVRARRQSVDDKYKQTESKRVYIDFSGDNRDQRSWIKWCSLWLADFLHVSEPEAYLMVFCDWRQLPALSDAVQAGGWLWRGVNVWDKTEGARMAHQGYFRAQAEFVVWATPGQLKMRYKAGGDSFPGVFRCSVDSDKVHLTQKPVKVFKWLLEITRSGCAVIDPFLGSGTTLVACEQTGRIGYGMEIEPKFVAVTLERVSQMGLEPRLVE